MAMSLPAPGRPCGEEDVTHEHGIRRRQRAEHVLRSPRGWSAAAPPPQRTDSIERFRMAMPFFARGFGAVPEAAYAAHSGRFIRAKPQPPALPAAVWINAPTKEAAKVQELPTRGVSHPTWWPGR